LNKKLFEENELWYLVFTLLSASSTYHKQDRKVGDIRPDNIFINEDGQVKVASVDSWPGEKSNYEKSFYEK
jgi:serine/threonine protein kinase